MCRKSVAQSCFFFLPSTLPETSMETSKRPYKDHSPFKGGLYGFPLGGAYHDDDDDYCCHVKHLDTIVGVVDACHNSVRPPLLLLSSTR